MSKNSARALARDTTSPDAVDRIDDEIWDLSKINERTGVPVATLRWWRHRHEGPPLWKLGSRVVGWRSDILRWLAEQQGGQR